MTSSGPRRTSRESRKSQTFKDPSGDVEGTAAFPVQVEYHDIYEGEDLAVDTVYYAKARILNAAFQEIGMGKYQVSAI